MTTGTDAILVIDDTESALYTKRQILTRAGFQVVEGRSGEEALKIVSERHPRLVVLDVKLPDIDGMEICRRIKANEETASVIVLQTSATYIREEDVTRALDEGADAALTEPIDPGVLVATVRALLRAREAEDALRAALAREQEARNAAESVNRIKDEFLATLSHELRSPLGAILTWVTLLRTDQLDLERTSRALEAIERNARLQMKLVADLLDVSRIISGKLSIELEPIRLRRVIEAAMDSVRSIASEKGVSLEITSPLDFDVCADETRLQQVIWNVLSNAVKFTARGGRVAIEVAAGAAGATIAVRDNGEGIDPAFLPHIFDRFRQADSSTTRRVGGLGLGLAIVHHLISLHHGHVEASSEGLGKGTTVRITIPLSAPAIPSERCSERELSPIPPAMLQGVEILIVDDEADAREAMAAVLERGGARVTIRSSVDEGLAALSDWTPDIIISDIGMPGRDGFAFVQALKSGRDALRQIPVLGVTAYAAAEDRKRVLRGGFNQWMAKPVEAADLTATVARLLRR